MRFSVELLLKKPDIDKEKNKIVMHLLKLLFENTNKKAYKKLYEEEENNEKNFTFSTYLGRGVKFKREKIYIPDQKIILNFSTYDIEEGILFYNSIVNNLGLEIPVRDNLITINKIKQGKLDYITESTIFSTNSPIVVREHKNNNKKTWYHNILDEKGFEVFMNNLKWQVKSNLKDIDLTDLSSIKVEVLKNKMVNIKHYGIVIPSNLAIIKLSGKSYIIDYFYKAGIGSRRSQGFGYLSIIN